MAGTGQHTIPRFFLENFVSRSTTKSQYTWLFRNNTLPIEINIKNATDRYFYGREEDGLDLAITDEEGCYSKLIQEILQSGSLDNVSKPLLQKFIVHLSIRTKHFRNSYFEHTQSLIQSSLSPILDNYEGYIQKFIRDKPEIIVESLMRRQNIPIHLWDNERPKYEMLVNDPAIAGILDGIATDKYFKDVMIRGVERLSGAINITDAKNAHIAAMNRAGISPEKRCRELDNVSWSINSYPDNSLILGDVCVWCIDSSSNMVSLAWSKYFKTIYLPLAHNKLLIGQIGEENARNELDWVNKASSGLSRDRFYSSANTSVEEELLTCMATIHFRST